MMDQSEGQVVLYRLRTEAVVNTVGGGISAVAGGDGEVGTNRVADVGAGGERVINEVFLTDVEPPDAHQRRSSDCA